MANIERINAYIATGTDSGAGTDAYIYLGIAGREFLLDASGNDFENGTEFTYTLGDQTNVSYPEYNDPRKPQLTTEDLHHPTYLRFVASGTGPDWQLDRVTVTVNPNLADAVTYDRKALEGEGNTIWLGTSYGERLYLDRV
ncbi:PLAT/LH2 domain-containing protein [Streptomyces noursei]